MHDGLQVKKRSVKQLVDYNEVKFLHLGHLTRRIVQAYLDHLRRDGRELPSDTLPEQGESPDPAEVFTQGDQAMRAHRALHRLPEPYREVFSLRVLGGLGFAAIGELFSKSQNWACVTYHRARQKLRDIMEDKI